MKKVFIVEDNKDMARIYSKAFESSGFEVEMAADGDDALAKLSSAETKPDLILLDIMMPKKDGFEVMEEISKNDSFRDLRNVPIFALTNFESLKGGEADLERARSLGAVDIIIKSENDPQDVVKKVEEIISKK